MVEEVWDDQVSAGKCQPDSERGSSLIYPSCAHFSFCCSESIDIVCRREVGIVVPVVAGPMIAPAAASRYKSPTPADTKPTPSATVPG